MFTTSPSRKLFPTKIDKSFDVAVSGASQRWEFKNAPKNRVEKLLQKNDK
jgi:hypothetical protein